MSIWKVKDRDKYILSDLQAKDPEDVEAKERAKKIYNGHGDFACFEMMKKGLQLVMNIPYTLHTRPGVYNRNDLREYFAKLEQMAKKEVKTFSNIADLFSKNNQKKTSC